MNDLAKVFQYEVLDKGFRMSMGSCTDKSPVLVYSTLKDMMARAVWALTLRKVLEK